MSYNGYFESQYYDQHQHHHQYQYPYSHPSYCGCPIYPVPFMPVNPLYAHAYVPYQTYTAAYPLGEALDKGTLFPEFVGLYDPYADYSKLKGCWDGTGYWKEGK